MTNEKGRLKRSNVSEEIINKIDLLNVVFIFIVFYLHHSDYTETYSAPLFIFKVNHVLQRIAVGGFIFLSGFKLSISKASDPIKTFALNRFLRIYILYAIAILFFSVTAYPVFFNNLPSWHDILIHLACIQFIFPSMVQHSFPALWFISLLFACYIFFLFTRNMMKRDASFKKNLAFYLTLFIILFSIFLLREIGFQWDILGGDFKEYLIIFALGMVYAFNKVKLNKLNNKFLFYFAILNMVLLCLYFNGILPQYWDWYINDTLGLLFVIFSTVPLYIAFLNEKSKFTQSRVLHKILKKISYASFCAFLFHRSIWAVMYFFFPEKSFFQWIYIVVLGIFLILLISYGIQNMYDRFLNRVIKKVS